MGGISARFKAFTDATSDFRDDRSDWGDKIASGCTNGSRFFGDKLTTRQGFSVFAVQHPVVWVGQDIGGTRGLPGDERQPNGDGSWLGLMATASPDKTEKIYPADAQTPHGYGIRLAVAAQRWQGGAQG